MTKNAAGFYLIPIPAEEVPLEQISAGNRSRAKKNRALKQEIREGCAGFLRGCGVGEGSCADGGVSGWGCGGAEEGRLVVAPAASLRPWQSGRRLRRWLVLARLKPGPFEGPWF